MAISQSLPRKSSRLISHSMLVIFFVSGSCGLIYEIVWMRLLGYVFGNTVYAAATVLAVFMGGLAIGSYVFGRLSDRGINGIKVYGILELVIGIYALALPYLIESAGAVYKYIYHSISTEHTVLTATRFAISAAILLIPTIMMGGTLPLLVRYLSGDKDDLGYDAGKFYAANTFGAVAGVLIGGFVALPLLGMSHSILLTALINIIIGLFCVLIFARVAAKNLPVARDLDSQSSNNSSDMPRQLLFLALMLFFTSGFAALLYEVAWTRFLTLVLGPSAYAFSLMLAGFITGLALGSALENKLHTPSDRIIPVIAWIELCIGLAMMAGVLAAPKVFSYSVYLSSLAIENFYIHNIAQLGMIFGLLLVPTMLLGLIFPMLARLIRAGTRHSGGTLGLLYAGNTVGAVLGSLGCGFLFIPWLGIQKSMMFGIALNIILSFVIIFASMAMSRRLLPPGQITLSRNDKIGIMCIGIAGLITIAVLPQWDTKTIVSAPYIYSSLATGINSYLGDVQFHEEGVDGTVTILKSGDNFVALRIEGKADASSGGTIENGGKLRYGDMRTQVLSGHIPLFLQPDPQKVLVIGLASGVTVGAVTQHPRVRQIDCVEISESVVRASAFFNHVNHEPLADPRVKLHIQDGRNYLLLSDEKYQAIISEPTNPSSAGAAKLFTKEFFTLSADALTQDGIMLQWIQAYRINLPAFQSIIRAFSDVYPYVSLWLIHESADLALIGSKQPLQADIGLMKRLYEEPDIHNDVWRVGTLRWEEIIGNCIVTEPYLRNAVVDVIPNTDDNSIVEYALPRTIQGGSGSDIFLWITKMRADENALIAPEWRGTEAAESIKQALAVRHRFVEEFARITPAPSEMNAGEYEKMKGSDYFSVLINERLGQ